MNQMKLVTNPYGSPDSRARKGLIIEGDWTSSIEAFIQEHDVRALFLNSSKGWTGIECSFLRRLKSIEELNIISPQSTGLEAIEEMDSLEELSLATNTTSRISFAKLAHLRKCFLDWWRGAETIFGSPALEDLYLYGAKLSSFEPLRDMRSLRALNLSSANIEDLKPIASLSGLQRLELVDCRKVASFESLVLLSELRWLRIEGVRDLGEIDFVGALNQLEVLQLSGVGVIRSLHSLERLLNLRAFAFPDNSNVSDGDLAVLTRLPRLAMLMFAPRKHYSHKLVKPWSWKNIEQPSELLVAK